MRCWSMKILVVTNMYPTAERPAYGIFVSEQVEALRASGADVEVDVHYINPAADGKSAYLKSMSAVHERIERGGYNLVHVHYGLSGLFLLHPRKKVTVPVVVTLHGGDIQPEQGKGMQVALTRRILKKADCAIALNERMARMAGDYCRRVETIPCAVDTTLFSPPMDGREALRDKQKLTIIFPSAHSRTVKNYPLFQRVVAEIERTRGVEVEEIELDGMSRHDIAWAMGRADLLLLTSISEGSPQVVKEAMAENLPVVSTAVGDVATLFEGVGNCVCGTDTELAQLVCNVIDGKVSGMSGRDKIMQAGLDTAATTQKILELYKSLIG